jgi:hypothetical protein
MEQFKIRSGLMGGIATIYGTEQCSWTTKQIDEFIRNGVQYEFVDCSAGQCPKSITAFPTVTGYNNQNWEGFQELG